ncbi:hypothetical protein GCM10010378_30230 [Streptomyces viridochromogenes]
MRPAGGVTKAWGGKLPGAVVHEMCPLVGQGPARQPLHHLVLMPDQKDRGGLPDVFTRQRAWLRAE